MLGSEGAPGNEGWQWLPTAGGQPADLAGAAPTHDPPATSPSDPPATSPTPRRPPHRSLAQSRALITGASSGIGAATAVALADAGARVFLTGRDRDALGRVAERTGGVFAAHDLTVEGAPEAVVDEAVEALGSLDVVVSSAGAGWAGPFTSMSAAELDWLFDLNIRVPGHLALAAAPHLRPSHGQLVLVGSIAGLVGAPGETWYSTTKAALSGLADGLRVELQPLGVGVTLISPGVVSTRFFARRNRPYERHIPRPISAEAVADTIVAALERHTDEVVLPSWLQIPVAVKRGFPALYRLLAARLS